MAWHNNLYFGDNLKILKEYIPDEVIDLVYLDPPFNSNATYNVLFAEKGGEMSEAQITAFEDTWHWGPEPQIVYEEIVTTGPDDLARLMEAFYAFLRTSDMMAYLTMMAPRLVEMHRVLKDTGSIYLHCDPTASHYLKLLMDAIFGPTNFRNEIIWRRSQPKSHVSLRYSRAHDVLLFYAKSEDSKFQLQHTTHDPAYIEKFYKHVEPITGRRYRLGDLTNPNKNRPNLTYEFPPGSGVIRVWRWTKARMMKAWEDGIIVYEEGGVIQGKRYLDEMEGQPVTDFWDDIEHLHAAQSEMLGYPTQKPEALLERVIKASSNEGDIVLDPFCGCGTTITVAERLKRKWVGIDVTHLAIALIKHRLHSRFGKTLSEYEVIGEPTDLASAIALAEEVDRYQFQYWAVGLVKAKPAQEKKKGADRGIDGIAKFIDDKSGKAKIILAQVKSGKVSSRDIRDLVGVLDREKAAIGLFITLQSPTREMIKEATTAGFFKSDLTGNKYPRVQILSIEDLLNGKKPDIPEIVAPAPRTAKRVTIGNQDELF